MSRAGAAPLRIIANLLHAPAELTGTGHYARELIAAMLALRGAPEIAGLVTPDNAAAFAQPGAANYRQIEWGRPGERLPVRRLREWALLNARIRREKPDVFWGPSNFLPLWRTGPMVATIHDMTFFQDAAYLPVMRGVYWRAWTRRTAAVADRILTVSDAARDDILRYLPMDPARIVVVRNGVSGRFFVHGDRDGYGARLADLRAWLPVLPRDYALFVGTLTAHKNLPRLIDALAAARGRTGEDIRLVLAGKRGHDYERIAAAIARHELGDAVVELGYVEDRALPALYENARVLVLPSYTEGFGLPIVEAMAAGAPVLTGDRGAMAEVAGDAAVTANPVEVDAWADGLARLWTDAELRMEMRRRGAERAKEFTWARAAERVLQTLKQAAGRC